MNDEDEIDNSNYMLYIRPVMVLEDKIEYEWKEFRKVSAMNNDDLLQIVKGVMSSLKRKKNEYHEETNVYRFEIIANKYITAYFDIKAEKIKHDQI